MSESEQRRFRADGRSNHLSGLEVTRRKSGPPKTLTPEEIAQMTPNKPTGKTIVVDSNEALMTTSQMIDLVKKTAEKIVRDLSRAPKGSDVGDLHEAYKLLSAIKKQESEAHKGEDLGQLMERALAIPELRDAMRARLESEDTALDKEPDVEE